MKRLISVILIGILVFSLTASYGFAECDVCEENQVFYGAANFLLAKSDKRIIGVKSPCESVQMLNESQTTNAKYPLGFVENGILRHKALALVKHYNGYASSMTPLCKVVITIDGRYMKEVEHIVRRKAAIFYGISEEEVVICPETIIIATLFTKDVGTNLSYAGHIFFTSAMKSICVGSVTFSNGSVAYLHMQDFDCDMENDLGFIPGWRSVETNVPRQPILIINDTQVDVSVDVNVDINVSTDINAIILYNVPYCAVGMEYWKAYEKEYHKYEVEVQQSSTSYSKSTSGVAGKCYFPIAYSSGETFSSSQSSVKVTEESYTEKGVEYGTIWVK